jgi:hypothetical protein
VSGEEMTEAVASAVQRATEAVDGVGGGRIDDLLLLQLLLEEPDDNLLRALGSRTRMLVREVSAERARRDGESSRRYPSPDDVVRYAAEEAADLGGWGAEIGGVHVLLALFAFRGAEAEALLRRCGVDWRPLRSVVRRLGLSW